MADTEQTRRDALHFIEHDVFGSPVDATHVVGCPGCTIDALVAELEQAERERDEALKRLKDCANSYASWQVEFEAQNARLAKVPALVEALRYYAEDQGPDGWGARKSPELAGRALAALEEPGVPS